MAFDGIVIANVVHDLHNLLAGGRINKIAQPENDELILTIKNNKDQYRLLMSANASLPLLYLTETNKPSPLTAPNFCMLLRKHLNNGKILSVTQKGLERVVDISIEHLNEMGDTCYKHLIIELMGKHSNIIFIDDNNKIIDSIKRVSAQISSVREVLPGRDYFIPDTAAKLDPLTITKEDFIQSICAKPSNIQKAIYTTLTGFSPCIATELCHIASIECERDAKDLSDIEREHLYNMFTQIMEDVRECNFRPCIIFDKKVPVEFCSIELTNYSEMTTQYYDSISKVLSTFYAGKNAVTRINQKSADLRKIVSTILERDRKKYELLVKQLESTDKRDKYRIYGELINTYGYNIEEGASSFVALNYYTNEEITIPLDNTLSPRENSVKYFDRYNKLKRTYEATNKLLVEVSDEIEHLESIANALEIALLEADLAEIKEELIEYGYIKRKSGVKKEKITSKPFHYVTEDNYHIYVGKNNYQNEELSFKLATGSDWWFHAKDVPGSHVIVKTDSADTSKLTNNELPDHIYEIAAALAAHYSKNKKAAKVEVDYTIRKNLKKPPAAKPGFVIYHTNYSMIVSPDISGLPIKEL